MQSVHAAAVSVVMLHANESAYLCSRCMDTYMHECIYKVYTCIMCIYLRYRYSHDEDVSVVGHFIA